jgi:hypothetical protein
MIIYPFEIQSNIHTYNNTLSIKLKGVVLSLFSSLLYTLSSIIVWMGIIDLKKINLILKLLFIQLSCFDPKLESNCFFFRGEC